MLNPWSKYPAIRLFIVFALGITTCIYLPGGFPTALTTGCFSLIIIAFFLLAKRIWLYPATRYVAGISANLAVGCIGYVFTHLHADINKAHHFSRIAQNRDYLLCIVLQPPSEKEKSHKTLLQVQAVYKANDSVISATGKILSYLRKDSLANTLQYGTRLLIPAKFKEIEGPKNPGQFNYRAFMRFKNVYHQVFLQSGNWRKLEGNGGNIFLTHIYALRNDLLKQLAKYIPSREELGVASALLLGYRDLITPDITQAYAASGALHVLCVSGLHVGMVFLVLSRVLFFLDKNNTRRIVKTVIIVLFIWLYACLTGLSPSVLRASAMFSMIALGNVFGKNTSIFNIIGASALILTAFNPFILTEVGFQLSYLAVIGIVYLQPIIARYLSFSSWLPQKIWEITAVSIAAQAATFPLGLYYFHQFPNFFLISNLVVIPAGWLLIHLGIAIFFLAPLSFLQLMAGKMFYFITYWLNRFIFLIDDLPYALLQGVSISIYEVLAIYAAILLASQLFISVKFRPLAALMIIILGLLLWNGYEKIVHSRQSKLVCYAVNDKKALAVFEGQTAFVDFDSLFLADESAMLFHVKHHWWKEGIQKIEPVNNFKGFTKVSGGYRLILNSKVFFVPDKNFCCKNVQNIPVDVLFIS
ncbi:MAG: ComEC family competence protein, partial [Chitinophagales bacterium]|nr:ComEC family competence protein [Chitinophagales bacterium]